MQTILLDAVRDRLGPDSLLTGHHLTGWDDTGTGIRAHFIDRRTNVPLDDAEGDLLIGAEAKEVPRSRRGRPRRRPGV